MTRSLSDIRNDQEAAIAEAARLNAEVDELQARKDRTSPGVKERTENVKAGLRRQTERISELILEERDAIAAGLKAGRFAGENGDGALGVRAAGVVPDSFTKAAEPWLPGIREYRQLQTKAVGTTGAFIPVQYATQFFDLLRKRTAVLAAGPVLLPVSSAGSVKVPRVTSSVTIASIPENSVITPADPGLGDITLDPVKFGAMTLVAREAVEDSAPQLRQVVAETLLRDLAVELDRQLVTGSGSGGNLRGLTNVVGVSAGPALGANGASLTFAHLADTIAAADNANADPDRLAWIMHSRTWGSVRKLVDSQSRPIVSIDPTQGVRPTLWGRPVFISNSLSITQTVGTSTDTSSIVLADMSQVIVAVARDLEVLVSEHYAFNADQVAIKVTCRYDIGACNPAAIVVTTGVRP